MSSLGRARTSSLGLGPTSSARNQATLCPVSHITQTQPHSLLTTPSDSQSSSELLQTSFWQQMSSLPSSLDLPVSLKPTLREALSQEPWESSPSISSLQDPADHNWQDVSATATSDVSNLSFNPLTYVLDSNVEAASTLETHSESKRESGTAEEGEEDMSSLTGMLRFVNQTLAMQEDVSV